MRQGIKELKARFSKAITTVFQEEAHDPHLTATTNPSFGDVQINDAMALAKRHKLVPREVAAKLVQALTLDDLCEKIEIAGPGFINLTFRESWLLSELKKPFDDTKRELKKIGNQAVCVIDFSSPNVAKDMHVGHLRSTIIGDSLAHAFELCGYQVLRRNHVGDWGTQFGMLITQLRDHYPHALAESNALDLKDLVAFYKAAKKRFDEDMDFQERARRAVVDLQAHDPKTLLAWKLLCDQSRREFAAIYEMLGVSIEEKGESFYNPYLPEIIAELEAQDIAVRHEGALCVFIDGFLNREGDPLPLIIQKSDGGFNYATTDLAALRYRIREEKASLIFYVIDAGQGQHVSQFIATARKAGWVPDYVRVEHVPFGLVLGPDGKKLKTRSGETVKLKDLLEEGVARALAILDERPDLDDAEKQHIAKVVGISAVKYADLSQNRGHDYVFNFDKMLSMQGNTAPFLLYSYARICGIARKSEMVEETLEFQKFSEPIERQLAFMLLRFDEIVEEVIVACLPNRMSHYLFELCQTFNRFYDQCPVASAQGEVKALRHRLCQRTSDVLREGLSILGIPVLERM